MEGLGLSRSERSLDLKIAMIGHKRVPSRDGGIEVAVEALACRMARLGHDVTLYNRGGDIKKATYQGVTIRRVPVIERTGISAVMGSVLATLRAVCGGYDCIHLHAEGIAAMAFLPRLLGIRTVVTIHGLDWKRAKWGRFASWYLKRGEKAAVRYAHEVVVLSQATRRYFQDTYGRDTVYIPNGMEPTVRRNADQILRRWGLEKDGYLLYLGRLVPEKGIHYLIEAFKNVKTQKRLVIAGSPKDMESYYAQLRQGAEGDGRILFTGFVRDRVLEELFSNCYVYCLPSELEGMPISLLEALSYGNCCVSSDIAECVEVVGEYGYPFPTGDTEALRELLQRLCDEPALVQSCRDRIRESFAHYTWDEVTEKTLEVYQGERDKVR